MPMYLTNLEKAAAMLICLGVDKAAQVFTHLAQDEVHLLASQMMRIGKISTEQRQTLLDELRMNTLGINSPLAIGGSEYVHRLLAQTFGEEQASIVFRELSQRKKGGRPFSMLRTVETHRIIDAIATEHPSVIALVLYYLPREKAAYILAGLVAEVRHEVVMRLINISSPAPAMISRLEELLAEKLSDNSGGADEMECDFGAVSGPRTLVEILARVDSSVEKQVYQFLQEVNPVLAEEVRKSMFVFEDIARLDTRALQLVLRELSSQEIALALKGSDEALRDLIFVNISTNTAQSIREELELMGPVRVSQVEEAQQKVVATVRRLSDAGTINLVQAEQEEMVV